MLHFATKNGLSEAEEDDAKEKACGAGQSVRTAPGKNAILRIYQSGEYILQNTNNARFPGRRLLFEKKILI